MEYERTCPQCGKEFTTTDYRIKYCSKECHDKKQRQQVKEWKIKHKYTHALPRRNCIICGKEFQPRNRAQLSCYSTACREARGLQKWEQDIIARRTVKCRICGKEFVRTVEHRLYCSDECKGVALKRKMAEKTAIYTKICKECGNEFQTATFSKEYCSPECKKRHFNRYMREHKRKQKQKEMEAEAKRREEQRKAENKPGKKFVPTRILGAHYSYPPPKAYIKIRPAALPASYAPYKPHIGLVRRQA